VAKIYLDDYTIIRRKHTMLRKTVVSMVTLLFLLMLAVAAHALTLTNFQPASLVLGQPNFTSGASGLSPTQVNFPEGVAVDPTTGKVFIADRGNNRVLRFASGTALVNEAAAEAVLGQSVFTSSGATTTQSGMNIPYSVSVDATGRLWVADFFNNRVLRFDNAASKANGANADAVLGQSIFTSRTQATTQSGMNLPFGMSGDAAGRLYVSDTFNNRVLWFDNAGAKANGGNADGVLGQPNFTSNTANNGGRSAQSLNLPDSLFYDPTVGGVLWVADLNNHRVLRYGNRVFQFLPIILKN
jgi:sugar lactone lactonase YvrE